MPQKELPTWVRVLLRCAAYSCAEPEYVEFRQGLLRKSVLESIEGVENGRDELCVLGHDFLAGNDAEMIDRALGWLFVLGTEADAPAVQPHTRSSDESVRKAAKTCLFEIRRRPAKA